MRTLRAKTFRRDVSIFRLLEEEGEEGVAFRIQMPS